MHIAIATVAKRQFLVDRISGVVAVFAEPVHDAAILAQVCTVGAQQNNCRLVHVIVADNQYQNLQCRSARVRCRQDLQ